MSGFSILMFIFAFAILLTGLYMYKGHKIGILECRATFKNLKKEEWINVGKWTMITSIIPFILAVIGIFIIKD